MGIGLISKAVKYRMCLIWSSVRAETLGGEGLIRLEVFVALAGFVSSRLVGNGGYAMLRPEIAGYTICVALVFWVAALGRRRPGDDAGIPEYRFVMLRRGLDGPFARFRERIPGM
jgi:hypothetical protein